jgi:hypothetical protein
VSTDSLTQTIVTPTESTSSSLAGIQTSPEIDSFVHPAEFTNGPTPTRLQRLPQSYGPWAPYHLRQDDLMNLDTDSSPSSHNSALSPASSSGRARRVGPLTQEGRRNANKVRDVGACLRCSCMKEKCDDGNPCGRCGNKIGRKWKLGCLRDRLEQRVDYFFPTPIANRYDLAETNRYIDGTGFTYLHHRPDFTISLSMGVGGPPLQIPVREVSPLEQKRILQSFQINNDSGSIDTKPTWDPPIVPFSLKKDSFVNNLFNQLGNSIRSVFDRKHQGGYYWPWRCFEDLSCHWVGEVAEKIHEFHHNAATVTYFDPIRKAHTALYFNYLLDHPFLVKEPEHISHLLSRLENGPDAAETPQYISPETIQRFVKASIFPFLRKTTGELLAKLHETLLAMARAKPKDEIAGGSLAQRDLAFSLAFMLLIIVGQTQSRLLMLSELSKTEPGINLSLHDAQQHIDEVEEKLGRYIIHFHEFATKKRQRPRQSNVLPTPVETRKAEEAYSANFQLMKHVEGFMRQYCKFLLLLVACTTSSPAVRCQSQQPCRGSPYLSRRRSPDPLRTRPARHQAFRQGQCAPSVLEVRRDRVWQWRMRHKRWVNKPGIGENTSAAIRDCASHVRVTHVRREDRRTHDDATTRHATEHVV